MSLSLLLLFSLVALGRATTFVNVTDPNWYFTEYNWGKGEGYAQAVNPGAYFKVGFTGTSVTLQLDFTGASTSNYSNLLYVIDGKPAVQFMLPLPNGDTEIILASGLPATNHTLLLFIKNSMQTIDRWIVPQCVTRVTGLILDDGATTVAPTLRPKRMIVYWDSIGEGVEVLDFPGTDLTHNDATQTWAMALAAGLQAEVSMVAFGRLGWTVYGNGNVPPLYTPGNDTLSSWDKIDSKHPRNFDGQLDYIFVGHGTNDMSQPDDLVEASAFPWLVATRAAVSPQTAIFMVVPFGGFKLAALTEVYTAYQAKYNDTQTHFLNLGAPAQEGLDTWVNGGTWQSEDGIHPNVWRDGQLGAILALAAGRYINYQA